MISNHVNSKMDIGISDKYESIESSEYTKGDRNEYVEVQAEKSNKGKKTVIILGPPRSGTSATAGVLSKLGIDMGSDKFDKSRANPLGYFEDEEMYDLNTDIINCAGGSRYDIPSRHQILTCKHNFDKRIEPIIQTKGEYWGWKDPGTVLTIELIIPYIQNPFVIICDRDIEDSTTSLYKMDQLSLNNAERVQKIYRNRIKSFCRTHRQIPKIIIEYNNFVNNSEMYIDKIISFLDIDTSQEKRENAIRHIRRKRELLILRMKQLILEAFDRPYDIYGYVIKRSNKLMGRIIYVLTSLLSGW